MGRLRDAHPARRTGWGGENQLRGTNPPSLGAWSRFLWVFVPISFLAGCTNMLLGDEEPETLRPTSTVLPLPDTRTYAPGHQEWDATVPSSYPTPLPTDVLILPED